MLLKCLNPEDARVLMGEVHEGVCGAHQSAHKMKWIIRRSGYFGRQCWKIVLNITAGVKIANDLVIFKDSQHQL